MKSLGVATNECLLLAPVRYVHVQTFLELIAKVESLKKDYLVSYALSSLIKTEGRTLKILQIFRKISVICKVM